MRQVNGRPQLRAWTCLGTQLDTEVLIDRVMAEIDMAGALRTRVYFSSRHSSGGFGITGSASYAITSHAYADGKKLSVTVDPRRSTTSISGSNGGCTG